MVAVPEPGLALLQLLLGRDRLLIILAVHPLELANLTHLSLSHTTCPGKANPSQLEPRINQIRDPSTNAFSISVSSWT